MANASTIFGKNDLGQNQHIRCDNNGNLNSVLYGRTIQNNPLPLSLSIGGALNTSIQTTPLQAVSSFNIGNVAQNLIIGQARIRGLKWCNPNNSNARTIFLYDKLNANTTDVPFHTILETSSSYGSIMFNENQAFVVVNGVSVRCVNGLSGPTTTNSSSEGVLTILFN